MICAIPDPLSDTTSMNKHEYIVIESNREPDKYHQSQNLSRYLSAKNIKNVKYEKD